MATQLAYLSNEAGVYLGRVGGHEGTYLQEFAQKVMTFSRHMVRKLSCMRAKDVQAPLHGAPQGRQARPRQTSAIDRPEGSRSRPRVEEGDDGASDDDSDDPTYGQEELGGSQLFDAPNPTQTQGSSQCSPQGPRRNLRRCARDHTDVGTPNLQPTHSGHKRRRKQPYMPAP